MVNIPSHCLKKVTTYELPKGEAMS